MGKGQAPWISEMYGYVFAAAEAKLKHILTEGIVVYPDEIGAGRRAPQPKHSAASTGPKHRAPALTLAAHGPGTAPAPEPDPDAKPWSSPLPGWSSRTPRYISTISPVYLPYVSVISPLPGWRSRTSSTTGCTARSAPSASPSTRTVTPG